MSHLPAPLLILFVIFIPVFFHYYKKNISAVYIWISCLMVLDIFNSQKYLNLTGLKLTAIVLLPYVVLNIKQLWSRKSFKIFCVYYVFLSLIGLYHGFIDPWPDLTGVRSIKDKSQFRTILHLGRFFLEMVIPSYIALTFTKERFDNFLKGIFYSSIVLAFSSIAEALLKIDFYHFMTAGRQLVLENRTRGFAYEPRGLSQNLAYATFLLPFIPLKWPKWFFSILFIISGFILTTSFTGVVTLVTGIFIIITSFTLLNISLVKDKLSQKKNIIGLILGSLIFLSAGVGIYKNLPAKQAYHLKERLNLIMSSKIVNRLEVFDAASINFLNHHPKHYLIGAGPGMIYLPASAYILKRDQYIWGNQFNALPHMGLVLLISNSGIIGLLIYICFLVAGFKELWKREERSYFILALLFIGLYFIQIRYFVLIGYALLFLKKENRELS